jgi:hypothetical protein
LQKSVSLAFLFRILLGKLYGVAGFRSATEVCQAKIRSQHAIWMQSAEVDALFPLSLSGWTEEEYNGYQDAVIECSDAIYHDPNDAAAHERRGDAQFAMVR